MKTLRDLLSEGVKLVPIFADPFCTSYRMGFFFNGIPHAIGKSFESEAECQQAIDEILSQV